MASILGDIQIMMKDPYFLYKKKNKEIKSIKAS